AELMESHLSYPVLAYYRSQHSNQSWVSALTTVLDVSALVMVGVEGVPAYQAKLTFAIARHAVVDIAHVFNTSPHDPHEDRLPPIELLRLQNYLASRRIFLQSARTPEKNPRTLRHMNKPVVHALSP